ncbi:hypothetical protein DFH07DRAFT_865897 [Mycena maculata]|uniref:Ubiquitin-like protease family profile domain-containing protein n=1 Tax=Mycena maculata TaxID=230809 RepID=A0AAD7JYN6_9AGAR|nr:hypothetical protein DFH07DRAFT_865897 [Mycena maculata]
MGPLESDVARTIDEADDAEIADWEDMEASTQPSIRVPLSPLSPAPGPSFRDTRNMRLHSAFHDLLPQLTAPLAALRLATRGWMPPVAPPVIQHICTASCNSPTTLRLNCLYISLTTCECVPIAVLLVGVGLFPSSPTKPKTAVSIDLLDIYRALFERSCDAVTALAAALHTIYLRRGFEVVSQAGNIIKDPFRAPLGTTIQWYSNLRSLLRRKTDTVLENVYQSLFDEHPNDDTNTMEASAADGGHQVVEPSGLESTMHSEPTPIPSTPSQPPDDEAKCLKPGRAHRVLRERCPACFGLEEWGRPLSEGGDIQLGSDGDGPIDYDPSFFLSKEKVDKVEARIDEAKRKKPRTYIPPIPVEAIATCEASWTAANENKLKSDAARHDSHGVFVITCRHSQVLFLCNIDTPGEKQKYVIAALEEVASMLPPQATMTQCYDVACSTDQSVNLRVCFVINAMHAYGHQWICQLVYSPRLHKGMGLTDAEGVERFWSRIRKLIGITRRQWNSRRIWMIDQYAGFVSEDGRNKLGDWIQRQITKNLASKKGAARRVLQECGVTTAELRAQWEEQKIAQTSVRSHAPVRLRRELDKVLTLQAQIDTVEKSIAEVKQSITKEASPESISLLHSLELTHTTLNTQAEQLYASLNIHQGFPELQGLPLDFVRTLLIARDLKINIRKRAMGTFYEWETLDRAVGGRHEALGTKLHQHTQKAISRRKPALIKAIQKYNDYCANLAELIPPECLIPLPQALSTELNGLREDPSLHDDVWITPTEGEIPRWLDDADVRDGIRALHLADRCSEESSRLPREVQNMSRWLKEEITVVTRALEIHGDSHLKLPLLQRKEYLDYLCMAWAPALTSHHQPLNLQPTEASLTASRITARAPVFSPTIPSVPHVTEDDDLPDNAAILDPSVQHVEAAEELDPGDTSESEEVIEVQNTLSEDSDEVDTTVINSDALTLSFVWEIKVCVPVLLPRTRIVVPCDSHPMREIEASDLARIQSPTGRLNGHLINGIAASLLSYHSHPTCPYTEHASLCAVFSTYDLPRVRYNSSDDELWRNIAPTRYWEKSLWIIPIHRPNEEHWVLVVASIHSQELWFFDSFGQRRGWRTDLKVRAVMLLITRMVVLANHNHHVLPVSTDDPGYPWIARPLVPLDKPRQTNGYDCGVWVLCMIVAVLHGYTNTGVLEVQMRQVRPLFTDYVLNLPLKQ